MPDFREYAVPGDIEAEATISDAFGGKIATADRFSFGDWTQGLTGIPVLANASVSFECELTNAVDEATHRIFFGRVTDIHENEEQGTLLYCMRRYING